MSDNTLIRFENVVKTYGKNEALTYALNSVNFSIDEGEFVAIMGSSGSGKSTAMNIIGCLDAPSSGIYSFDGIDTTKLSANKMAILRKHYIGFIFQGFNLLGRTSALENVELPLIYQKYSSKKRKKLAYEALEKVGLSDLAHHTPAQLSGGQQQRVAIARAIVTSPVVLLADEPTGNLDSIKSIEIMELLKSFNVDQGITVIMVTHEPDMAEYASRRIYFRDGHIEESLKKGFK